MAIGERRFLTAYRQADEDFPGLIQEDDGTVWVVLPDGSRVQVTGGGGGGGGVPSGPAGGVLDGTYPDPGFAIDMATQAELNAVAATAVSKAVVDAAGDLIVGSGSDTVTRLPIGANNKLLGVSSGSLAWVDNTGTPGATGATGPAGTGSASVMEAQLGGNSIIGATTITLDRSAPLAFSIGTYVIIDPFTIECEIRRITGVSGTTLTLDTGLTYAHSTNDQVWSFIGGLVPWNWWGALPGSTAAATQNVTAFNRLTNQIYGLGSYYYGGIFCPPGIWYIDGELRQERDQLLQGTNVMNSKIVAHTTFSFPDSETAMYHPYRDGVPVTFGTGGVSGRWMLRNIYFDGNNVAGSNGVLSSPQQPDSWENLRVDNCKGYGTAFCDVQQHIIKNFEGINNGISTRIRNAGFVWIDGWNSENADTNDVLMDCLPGGGMHHIHWENAHSEHLDGTTSFLVDMTNAASDVNGLVWDHIWISCTAGQKMFEFPNAAIPSGYELRHVRANGALSTVIGIDDAYRGESLNIFTAFSGYITSHIRTLGSFASATNLWGHPVYWAAGDGAGEARIAMSRGSGGGAFPTPTFFSRQHDSKNIHYVALDDTDAEVWRVGYNGSMRIMAAATIFSGTGVPSNAIGSDGDFYLRTDTPGASNQRLYVKASGAWAGII